MAMPPRTSRGASPCLRRLMAAVVLVIAMGAFEEGQAAPKCAVLLCPPGRGPAAAGPLVLRRIGGLRLRGGADGLNDSMRDEDDDGAGSEVDDGAESHVPVAVQNTCFGRNEFFNASVDADMLVKDLKRELYANYSTRVCDPEQMEVWWAGKELKGLSHDTLRSYGFSPPAAGAAGAHAGSPERLVVKQKFLFSPQFAGEATKRQQQRGGAQMGLGGQQAQLAAMHNARMQALLQDPAELNKLMQSPEFQQILASNPEVAEMLKDPEMLRRTMQAAADPAAMRSMLEQQDRMLFNILAQPGGANALKRMTRDAGAAGEGGSGFSDALSENMRLKHLSPEQDEEIQSLARLRGEELRQVLERLPHDKRSAVVAAREHLLMNEMGYDRVRFKDSLAANATLAREYGALHRRYGNVQQLRQALASNSTLAASHSLLASLLRASTAAGGPNASAGSSAWPFASRGADASGGPSDDAAGMLAAGPQPITDDHVQSALRLAMSNLAAPDEDDPEEEGGQGADANADGSKEMHFADAHAQDDVERHEATGTLPVAADAAPDDLPVLLDSAALDVTGGGGDSEMAKESLLELSSRDPMAAASMATLLHGLANQQNLSSLSPTALGPLQELWARGSNQDMFRHLAHDGDFMQRILELARKPQVMQVLREHPAFSELPQVLVPPPPAEPAAAQGPAAWSKNKFAAVFTPAQEPDAPASTDEGAAEEAGSREGRSSGSSMSDAGAQEEPADAEAGGVDGDVQAPVIARERQRERQQEDLGHQSRRIGGKQSAPHKHSSDEEERQRARLLVERGNAAITSGNFQEAASLFQDAHEVLKKVDGAKSPAAHKTKALASAMQRKAAQLRQSSAAASPPAAGRGEEKGARHSARSPVGGPTSGSRAESSMAHKRPHASPPLAAQAPPSYSPSALGPGAVGRGVQMDDEDNSVMFMSHALGNAPPPPPEARATDEPPRPGEDAEAAAARQWLAHRHDCTVLSQRIMRKFAADEEYWAKNPDKAPSQRSHEDGTFPPDLILFYAQFNATEMREALDAPELPRSWIVAHQEDEEILRKEAEEEEEQAAAEEAAQKAQEEAEAEAARAAEAAKHVAPGVKYAQQLAALKDMGFPDERANLEALIETGGSVENAISRLLPS